MNQTISTTELKDLLAAMKGAKVVTIVANVDARLNKAARFCPQGHQVRTTKKADVCPTCVENADTLEKEEADLAGGLGSDSHWDPDTCPVITALRGVQPMTVRKNPNPGARKISHVNGMVNWVYENSVNRQRGREQGEDADLFVSHPRKWGTRIHGTPFVEHKGKLYVEMKVERVLGTRYEDADGQEISADAVAPFQSPKKGESARQGVEQEIILRDYGLDTITAVTFGGETLEVRNTDATDAEAVA